MTKIRKILPRYLQYDDFYGVRLLSEQVVTPTQPDCHASYSAGARQSSGRSFSRPMPCEPFTKMNIPSTGCFCSSAASAS